MWERQTPAKLLSFLQALIVPGMSHSLSVELSLGQAQGELQRSSGRLWDEHPLHKAATAASQWACEGGK